MFNLFGKCKQKPLTMYKVSYDHNDDCYWGYKRTSNHRFAPFAKVRNTFSRTFDGAHDRLLAVIGRIETSKSVEF